jgi:integrase
MPRAVHTDTKYIETRSSGKFRVTLGPPRFPERIRQEFSTIELARAWRDRTITELESVQAGVVPTHTLGEAYAAWKDAAHTGVATPRRSEGETYKAGALRGYMQAMEGFWLPKLGADTRLMDLRHQHLKDLIRSLAGDQLARNTVNNYLSGLRVVLNWAKELGWLPQSWQEASNLSARGKAEVARDRIIAPTDALKMLAVITDQRAQLIYALAFFTGLRRGELQALRWGAVDLGNKLIHVREGFDPRTTRGNVAPSTKIVRWADSGPGAFIAVKYGSSERALPIPDTLMPYLLRLDATQGLVCGDGPNKPFTDATLKKARTSWSAQGIEGVTLHEARHTYASYMIAAMAGAGKFNPKVLQRLMGHSSITTTYDRYGKLFPGSEQEAGEALNEYITVMTQTA